MRKVRFAGNDEVIGDLGDQRTVDAKQRRHASNEITAAATASDEVPIYKGGTTIPQAPAQQQQDLRNGWLLDLALFTELLDAKVTNTVFHALPVTPGRYGIDITLRNILIVLLGYQREDVLPSTRYLEQLRTLYDNLGAIENRSERHGVQEVIKMLESAANQQLLQREKSSKGDKKKAGATTKTIADSEG